MSYTGYKPYYKPSFFVDPENNLLDGREIRSTRFNEETMRVTVYGRDSRFIRSYLYGDIAEAEHVRDEFNKIAIACQSGEDYTPNWNPPSPPSSPKAKTPAV